MKSENMLRYSILDPTGNLTAIVESPVEIARQPELASRIMRLRPEVEQVGFLSVPDGEGLPALRMAGGEFCGNASMSAAALVLIRQGLSHGELLLRVSGAEKPVAVRLRHEGSGSFEAELQMPSALGIAEEQFVFGGLSGTLPLVRMEGISHLIVEPASAFFALLQDRPAAEEAVRRFCTALGADGLGMMFLEGGGDERRMTPLVYVPGSGTCFWENSCASGSAAVGMLLAAQRRAPAELALQEPAGTLRVTSDPKSGEVRLRGGVRLTEQLVIPEAEL